MGYQIVQGMELRYNNYSKTLIKINEMCVCVDDMNMSIHIFVPLTFVLPQNVQLVFIELRWYCKRYPRYTLPYNVEKASLRQKVSSWKYFPLERKCNFAAYQNWNEFMVWL